MLTMEQLEEDNGNLIKELLMESSDDLKVQEMSMLSGSWLSFSLLEFLNYGPVSRDSSVQTYKFIVSIFSQCLYVIKRY